MNAKLESRFKVGAFDCVMTLEDGGIKCRWTPTLTRELTECEAAIYQERRDLFFAELAAMLAGNVLVMEPDAVRVIEPGASEGRGNA